jgi:subtilase family serine protease
MQWGTGFVMRGRRLACVCAAGIAAGVIPAASSAGGPARVRIGNTPHLARDARVVGTLAPAARLHVAVVLKARDPAGLAAFVQAVSTPGTSRYHAYLTPAQFAERFGATAAQIRAVDASLRSRGLTPGAASPNGLSIPVTATAGQIGRAFSLSFQRLVLPGGGRATIASAAPAVDASIADDVQSVLGLSSLNTFRPGTAPRTVLPLPQLPRAGSAPAAKHNATGGPAPCSSASSSASNQGGYTADQIASAYRFSSLYQAGDQGQGQTIAMYELEPYDPNDIAAYQSCYGTHASVSNITVDGGSGSGAGSGESALDIENAIGLAPKANYLVYEAPNSNSGAPGSGPYDMFSAIISQNRAKVVSVSWGECESNNADALAAENTLFQEAAAQGQSIVSAAGDNGSEDCYSPPGSTVPPTVPDLSLAVDDPASQPLVTGVGGTTLSSIGPPPGQSAWNNGGNPAALAGLTGGAGGGGISSRWQMPGYQSGAVGSLNLVQSHSSGSPCGLTSGFCREVPDVAANADPSTGYMVYWNGSGADPTSTAGWQSIGGTSGAAPLWAALLALINASSACHGSPVGFANPALYRAAGSAYGSDFNDVTSGNNDFSGTNGNLYPAGPGYDMATGLGTPIAGGLAASLCGASLHVTSPGSQRSSVGQAVSLQLKTTGPQSGTLTWRASGLPPGLSISASSGRISGKPRRAGLFSVAVGGTNRVGVVPNTTFAWTVMGFPTISHTSLGGIGGGRPRLALAVSAGAYAAPLKLVTITLPAGLRFGPGKRPLTVSGAGGRAVAFSSRLAGGRLQISLAAAQPRVTVSVGYAAISATGGLAGRVRGHLVKTLQLRVATTDASGRAATATARIKLS